MDKNRKPSLISRLQSEMELTPARVELLKKLQYLSNHGNEEKVFDLLANLSNDVLLQQLIDEKTDSHVSIIPDCHVRVDGVLQPTAYASLRSKKQKRIPEYLRHVNWKKIMGALRDQENHLVCWAIVVSELIRAIRIALGVEKDMDLVFSPQDLIDNVDPIRRKTLREVGNGISYPPHYCYPNSMKNGLDYVVKNGIQREEDRPFIGCMHKPPDTHRIPKVFIKGYKRASSVDEMFAVVKTRPVGASLAVFHPEIKTRQKQMYRGAETPGSQLSSLHAVSIVGIDEENGETFAWVRSSSGDRIAHDGYYKVSLDTLILHLPRKGEEIAPFNKNFLKPSPLLSNFIYPIVFTQEEEEERRKKAMSSSPSLGGVDPKSILCELFKAGQCQKSFKCNFSHDLSIQRKGEKIENKPTDMLAELKAAIPAANKIASTAYMQWMRKRDADLAASPAKRPKKDDHMSGGELFVDEAEASEEYQREKEDEEESEQKAEQSDEDDFEMG